MKTHFKKLILLVLLFIFNSLCFFSAEINIANEKSNKGKEIKNESVVSYYIDSKDGNDNNMGTSQENPWKTLLRLDTLSLKPGDFIRFKRGSEFIGPLFVRKSGTLDAYITLSDYGNSTLPAPAFTNKVFKQDNFGNCIRLKGSYVIVENLYFHNTTAFVPGTYQTDGGWIAWEMGAIFIDKGATYCIVRNNELFDCPAGIKSYGEHSIIENNYVHDCNRSLAEWNWGPIGIWLGADYQEVRYNKIINISVVDPHIVWRSGTGGADGGAIEIDDARYEKTHISIHHNYSRECQGFMEVTGSDVLSGPKYESFSIHHNVSDDYQQFIALWRGANCRIENNTIIRRRQNPCNWGVFNITQKDGHNLIQNNIIVVEKDIRIFNLGLGANPAKPANIIKNNLYFAASETLNIGLEGPGLSPVYGNPKFVNYATGNKAEDFAIQAGSPAIDKGKNLEYTHDFINKNIPMGEAPDIGAFEYDTFSSVTQKPISSTTIYSSANTIIINNLDQHKRAIIYNLLGGILKRVDLVGGKNYINIPDKQVCFVRLENGVRAIIN